MFHYHPHFLEGGFDFREKKVQISTFLAKCVTILSKLQISVQVHFLKVLRATPIPTE